MVKKLVRNIPIVGPVAQSVYRRWISSAVPFANSRDYWIERYKSGGNSGAGSYDRLAEFKAEILNDFVSSESVETVIEFGCGDGNQLKIARYPSYVGFDVSPQAVKICGESFAGDATKKFKIVDDYQGEKAQLTLSLDVIYHLVEDEVFENYMGLLFDSSERYVIAYSSDKDEGFPDGVDHVRHRKFTRWVENMRPAWKLIGHIPNRYPLGAEQESGSFAEFFIFSKR